MGSHRSFCTLHSGAGKITFELNHSLDPSALVEAKPSQFRICKIWLSHLIEHPEPTPNVQPPKVLRKALEDYFDGHIEALGVFKFELDQYTPFQQSVLNWLSRAPAQLYRYSDIATGIGKPKAARAVGSALKKNPLPLLIPCHRITPSKGGIGSYLGDAEAGSKFKQYLLWHEALI